MPKLAEGNRAYDAVPNVAVLAAELNDLQDQLKGMLGPRWVSILRHGSVETDPAFLVQADPHWQGTTNVWELHAVIPLTLQIPGYIGQKITGYRVALIHAGANAVGGELAIYSQGTTPAAGAMPAAVSVHATADPFNTGGVGAWYQIVDTTVSIVMNADTEYYLKVLAYVPNPCQIAAAEVRLQFGN